MCLIEILAVKASEKEKLNYCSQKAKPKQTKKNEFDCIQYKELEYFLNKDNALLSK